MQRKEQLRMLLHPERYTDEQLDEMLNETDIPVPDIQAEWQHFKAGHTSPPPTGGVRGGHNSAMDMTSPVPSCRRGIGYRVAAAFIGLLLLSGIAYAAVQMVRHGKVGGDLKSPTQEVRISNSPQQQGETQSADSIVQPRIFENTPLDEMVTEIAHYYNKVVDIQSEQAHELRLYYKWEPQDALESVVEDLNHFDRVSLALENDKLIIKP